MFLVTDLSRKFPRTVKLNDTKDVGDVITGITGNPAAGHTAELIAASMTFGEEFTCRDSFKLRCVTDDEAETWVEEPAPVSMGQRLRGIIAAHNRMIETINAAEMTCNLLQGMEVWHKIACEGADITGTARSIGINAKVNMQSGVIHVSGMVEVPDAYPELAEYDNEYYRADLWRDNPATDGPNYEAVFEVVGERYYCFLHGTESLMEALGLFFKNHPHVTYDMIVEHKEV